MSTYQGHHSDGSSIQKHSAGELYPFVVQMREAHGGLRYELIGPGIDTALEFASYDDLVSGAKRLLAVRENDDAWSFELEQLCHVAGQKQTAMVAAARSLQFPIWSEMSRIQRTKSLLALGVVRNTLRLPMTRQPVFAGLAARMA